MQSNPSKLPFHEWFAVVLLAAFLTTLTLLSWWNKDPVLQEDPVIEKIESEHIHIEVIGEVERPGKVKLRKGTTLAELKQYVRLKPEGDPAFFNQKRHLKEGETVSIPPRIRS